jgi:hypothetical protein
MTLSQIYNAHFLFKNLTSREKKCPSSRMGIFGMGVWGDKGKQKKQRILGSWEAINFPHFDTEAQSGLLTFHLMFG